MQLQCPVAMDRGRLLLAGASLCLLVHAVPANAQNKIALGDGAVAKNPYDVAIGPNAVASGDGSSVNMAVAIGGGAQATAGAIAIGDNWRGGVKASGRDSIALGTSSMATQQSAVAIGAGSSATQANAVALGSGSVTAAAVATTSVVINGATFRFAGVTPSSTISMGNVGNERTITNVAAGRITATSTDTVNGSQLFASNAAINALGGQVSSLGHDMAAALGGASSYNSATGSLHTSLSYGGASYTSVQGVLDQLSNTVGNGSIKYLRVNSTLADASPTGANAVAIGPTATAGAANAVSIGNGAVASANAGDVALGAGSTTTTVAATQGAVIGGTSYTFAGSTPTSTVSVGSTGNERTITHVAAGRLGGTSTDAVNGSQLFATNQQVGANTTAIENLSSTVENIANGGAPNKYFQVSGTGAASAATGVDAIAAGPDAHASGERSLAQGSRAKATGQGSIAIGADTNASGVNSVAVGVGSNDDGQSNVVSVGSSTQQRRITHVAAGTDASDAVNVGQLDAAQAGGVQYDHQSDGSVDYGNVTLGADSAGTQLHRVASGTSEGDAVNLGQLNTGVQTAENWAKNYTDQRIQAINQSINTVGARANAGIASAIAMAGLPQAYQPNQNAAAVAFGSFHGQAGMAIGVSTISGSGRWVYKLNLASNTRGDAAASVGAAVTW